MVVSSARSPGAKARRLAGAACFLTAAALVLTPATAHATPSPHSLEVVRPDEPIRMRPDASAPRRGAALRGARLPELGRASGPGCAGDWYAVGPIAWICAEGVEPSRLPPGTELRPTPGPGLPFAYYFVKKDGSFGYRNLATAEDGVPDAQFLPGFGVALRRIENKPGGDPFGLTTHSLWVPLRDLGGPVRAPEPLAVELGGEPVAWVNVTRAAVRRKPGGQRVAWLDAMTRVVPLETREIGESTWLRVGNDAWVAARDTTSPRPAAPPAETLPGERWIDVNLERQVLTAYAGELGLFAMPVSTGRGPAGSELATPTGAHRLWVKLASSDMDNLENLEAEENYAIQAVPWVMYFDRGVGLHGTFWHHAFGRVQSHGCVNLTPGDAARLFAWTSPRLPSGWSAVLPTDYERGTLVRVR